jgi:hypothetical protein
MRLIQESTASEVVLGIALQRYTQNHLLRDASVALGRRTYIFQRRQLWTTEYKAVYRR